jgi:hypothetical protein
VFHHQRRPYDPPRDQAVRTTGAGRWRTNAAWASALRASWLSLGPGGAGIPTTRDRDAFTVRCHPPAGAARHRLRRHLPRPG